MASVAPRSDDCAKDGVTLELATLTFVSWNQIHEWVRRLDTLQYMGWNSVCVSS